MAGHRPAEQLLRKREDPRQPSFLELFFDLAFIVALTLLAGRLLSHLEWAEVAQTLVLLAAALWIWIATAWATDWYNPGEPFIQRLVLGIMFVAIDYGIAWFGWPTLGIRRVSEERLRTAGEHRSERYRQVFIIALSEIVLLSGMAYSGWGFDPVRTLAFAISFGNAVLFVVDLLRASRESARHRHR